eukprot:1578856-Pleurochrysis_carterae.AAC.1
METESERKNEMERESDRKNKLEREMRGAQDPQRGLSTREQPGLSRREQQGLSTSLPRRRTHRLAAVFMNGAERSVSTCSKQQHAPVTKRSMHQ